MNFEEMSDDEWTMVSSLVSDEPPIRLNRRGRPRAEPRVVANAVLWILTTGESWSRLPARYPSGPTCRRRFDEWHVSGTLVEIVERLSRVGRHFVYVPEPAQPVAQSAAAVVEEAVEDDGLPAVFWKSPEAWQAPDAVSNAASGTALADPIERMTRQLASAPPPMSVPERTSVARARTTGAAPSAASLAQSRPLPRDESPAAARSVLGASSAPQSVQVAEWRGYAIDLTVQPVRERMYRAAVEILKDGRRVERSGLIGPPFQDRDAAKHFAFDWARKWIERECRGAPAARPAVSPGVPQVATRGSHTVVTRPAPSAAAAPGNVRLAPLQRYTASGAPLPGAENRDVDAAAGGTGERRTADPRGLPPTRTHVS